MQTLFGRENMLQIFCWQGHNGRQNDYKRCFYPVSNWFARPREADENPQQDIWPGIPCWKLPVCSKHNLNLMNLKITLFDFSIYTGCTVYRCTKDKLKINTVQKCLFSKILTSFYNKFYILLMWYVFNTRLT